MFTKVSIFILIIFSLSCNKNESLQLKKDKLLTKYFNESEVNDLEEILHLFENEISKNCNDTITGCFKNFLMNARNNIIIENFEFSGELSGEIIQKKISKSTFNKIWYNSYMFTNKNQDTIPIIMIKTESPYIDFLKELSESKPYLTKYLKDGTSPLNSFIQGATELYILNHYDRFNLSDERDRLILAIHYLSVNEDFK